MAEKRFSSLLEEEKLTEKIRSYPALYNKSHKGYKERDAISNAWKEVADGLDFIENGKSFKKCLLIFFVLKYFF